MKFKRLSRDERKQTLRIGLLGISFSSLWNGPSRLEWWEQPSFMVIYFIMGIFEVFGGVTGYYPEGVIPRLGAWHACFDVWLMRALGNRQGRKP